MGSASADFYGRRPHSNPSCWPSSLPTTPGSRRANEQIFAPPPLSTRQVCSSHRQMVFWICLGFCTCQTLLSQYLSDSTKISTNSDMAILSTFQSTDILALPENLFLNTFTCKTSFLDSNFTLDCCHRISTAGYDEEERSIIKRAWGCQICPDFVEYNGASDPKCDGNETINLCKCILILLCANRLRANKCNTECDLCSKKPLGSLSLGSGACLVWLFVNLCNVCV